MSCFREETKTQKGRPSLSQKTGDNKRKCYFDNVENNRVLFKNNNKSNDLDVFVSKA